MPLVSKAFGDIITFTRASSATFTGSNGLIQSATTNAPRFDYDPVTLAAKGLLIEEQRTNLLTYSEQFDNGVWTKGDATVTANATTAPDGTATADKLVENTANAAHFVNQSAGTLGVSETRTIYAKAAERTWLYLGIGAGSTAYFDLANGVTGTVVGGTASISAAGNGWYRCSLTATRATNTNNVTATASANGTITYTGDGTSGLFIWGAQLEAGSFATSYIPTVASQVTRSADVASVNTLSPWYNATEGTLFVESNRIGTTMTSAMITDGSLNNFVGLYTNSSGVSQGVVSSGGVSQAAFNSGATSVGTPYKVALAFKANDFAYSSNGAAALTDTSGSIPVVNVIGIGQFTTGSGYGNGHIRRITYYPRRLSNAELQTITA